MASPVYRDRLGYWRRKCPGRPDLVPYASFATLFTVAETTALGENETGSSSDGTEVCLTRGTHIILWSCTLCTLSGGVYRRNDTAPRILHS